MDSQNQSVVSSPRVGSLPAREEEALRALNSTRISRGTRVLLTVGFLTISCSDFVSSCGRSHSTRNEQGGGVSSSFLRELFSGPEEASQTNSFQTLWRLLPSPAAIRRAEKAIEEQSFLAATLRSRLQTFLFEAFGIGNEQVESAPGGWLFFRRDLDYLNSRPFLDKAVQAARARSHSISPDSVAAISDFHGQLASRGIRLLVVPVPVKPCIEAHRLREAGSPAERPRQNASYAAWLKALDAQGVSVFDPAILLQERALRTGAPQFLRTDTHWTPEAMEAVAEAVALKIDADQPLVTREKPELQPAQITGHGDTVPLLGLPREQASIQPQTVTIHQNLQNGALWKPDRGAGVLLLGDSFSNIYSLGAMGWGEGAGFAEHLSARLGRPVDTIVRNSDGAFATRQMLQKELASGNDRLAGKNLVVWEFAVRELAFGDWKVLTLDAPAPSTRTFYCPPVGAKQRVSGVVARVSAVPRPGSVPYKEHIVAVHLVDVVPEGGGAGERFECVVYTWSMREQQPTAAARLRAGDSVSAELTPWDDVSDALEKFQRSELDEPSLLLEAATWAESFR
jgi:hypothetical protein